MPLVTSQQLFRKAQQEGYAIGAFNVENMEMVQAVAAAAEELKSPVIMQTTSATLKYGCQHMSCCWCASRGRIGHDWWKRR